MSWSDPCGNCGQHRADCDCGNWNNYKNNNNMIPTQKENPNGLHGKYFIQKILCSSGGDYTIQPVPDNAEYFVLRLDSNQSDKIHLAACRKAILTYANEIAEHLPELSNDLLKRYSEGYEELSPCCGAPIITESRICKSCKEHL